MKTVANQNYLWYNNILIKVHSTFWTGVNDDRISLNWLLQVPVNNYHLAWHESWNVEITIIILGVSCNLVCSSPTSTKILTHTQAGKWLSFLLACSFCNKEDKWVLAKKMATFGKQHYFCDCHVPSCFVPLVFSYSKVQNKHIP